MKTTMKTGLSVTQLSSMDILLLPIGEHEVGEDPFYGEEFSLIKLEINRLSDTDYPEVARLCQKILKNEAKDLRIAGYYLMAKVFNEGITGMLEAVELYIELIKRYGDACYPQRQAAKLQAIAWLNNEKLSAFVRKIELPNADKLQSISTLKLMLETLNSEFVNLYGNEVTQWTSLNDWIKKNLSSVSMKAEEVNSVNSEHNRVTRGDKSEISSEITSELVFTRSVERLLEYFANEGDLARMVSVSRAIKWSEINLPNSESGTTRIAAPREAVIAAAEMSNDTGSDESQLYVMESYFMEAGCQYFIDLQMQEFKIATTIGREDIAETIESFLRMLIKRRPELIYLKYSDGMPFANESTRRWLKQLDIEKVSKTTVSKKESSNDLDSKLSRISDDANECDLIESIEKLSQLNAIDQSQLFKIDLAKIDMCVKAGRDDIALMLAQKLEAQVERYRLAEWDRSLALALWDKQLLILQNVETEILSKDIKIDEIKERMCATDIGFALGVF